MKTAKLVVGILSICLSAMVLFQSCADCDEKKREKRRLHCGADLILAWRADWFCNGRLLLGLEDLVCCCTSGRNYERSSVAAVEKR